MESRFVFVVGVTWKMMLIRRDKRTTKAGDGTRGLMILIEEFD